MLRGYLELGTNFRLIILATFSRSLWVIAMGYFSIGLREACQPEMQLLGRDYKIAPYDVAPKNSAHIIQFLI